MIIDAISDLHGYRPKLEGGDLLIVSGDLTANDTLDELLHFHVWVTNQLYHKTIVIAGNHDNMLREGYPFHRNQFMNHFDVINPFNDVEYLCDSCSIFSHYPSLELAKGGEATERRLFKIWGSPWTKTFEGMNPHCKAFAVDTEEELAEKWELIPEDIDILVTHSPPYGMLDIVLNPHTDRYEPKGSISLNKHLHRIKPKVHIFGHMHEGHGQYRPYLEFLGLGGYPISVNASHVNEKYQPVNQPVRIVL